MLLASALLTVCAPSWGQTLASPRQMPTLEAARAVLAASWDGSQGPRPVAQLLPVLPRLSLSPAPRPQERVLPRVESGDLLFLDLDCGALCDAMAEVTQEQFGAGPRLNHVGIVEVVEGEPCVWEAWPGRGVSRTSLVEFLSRVKGGEDQANGFYVGRLSASRRNLADSALTRVKSIFGAPYDPGFGWNGPGMYCSKLISFAFGEELFLSRPMSYGKPGSWAREFWRGYFAARHMDVPDGQPGASPLSVFLDGQMGVFQHEIGLK